MALVDPDFAEWLGRAENRAIATAPQIGDMWAALGLDTEISSPLAFKNDGQAEAQRQLAFRSGPAAVERLDVPGARADLIGRVVTLKTGEGAYAEGRDVFVIGVDETEVPGRTMLSVIRRLA